MTLSSSSTTFKSVPTSSFSHMRVINIFRVMKSSPIVAPRLSASPRPRVIAPEPQHIPLPPLPPPPLLARAATDARAP